jgi:hypothetical protein
LKDLAGHIHSEHFAAAAAPVVVAAATAAAAGVAAQAALLSVTITVMLTGRVWPLA